METKEFEEVYKEKDVLANHLLNRHSSLRKAFKRFTNTMCEYHTIPYGEKSKTDIILLDTEEDKIVIRIMGYHAHLTFDMVGDLGQLNIFIKSKIDDALYPLCYLKFDCYNNIILDEFDKKLKLNRIAGVSYVINSIILAIVDHDNYQRFTVDDHLRPYSMME